MFYCEECRNIFENYVEKRYRNSAGEELDPPTYHCPECGSDFIVTVEQCDLCDDWHHWSSMNGRCCDDCLEKIEVKLRKLINNNFTVTEVEAIKDNIDLGGIL